MGDLATRFTDIAERIRAHHWVARVRSRVRAHCRRDDPLAIAVAILALGAASAAGWFTYQVFRDLPGTGSIREIANMATATTLLDARDQPAFTLHQERRLEVALSEMSPTLVRATLAIEDQRFYEHGGVDVVRVV